ncbi:MAG: ATP-binding protein [Eubacterium sp.]
MIIKDIRLTNFGKFANKEIKFEKGMNIIYGENEAGKTTIHTFLRGMLFGIEKQRGKATAKDTYSKYEPWDNPSFYEGVMRIEAEGIPYRIERIFNKDNKSCVVVREDIGRELTPKEVEELFSGFNENCYYNTISISQLGSATDRELETILKNYAANLGSTKSTDLDMKAAIDSLKEKRKKISSDNRLDEKKYIEKKIISIREELDLSEKEQAAMSEDILSSKKALADMEVKRKQLEIKDAAYRDEIAKHKLKVEDYKEKIEILNKQLEEREGFRLSKRVELGELKKSLREMGYDSTNEIRDILNKVIKKPRICRVSTIICIITFAISEYCYYLLHNTSVALGFAAAAIISFLVTLIVFVIRSAKKKRAVNRLTEAEKVSVSIDELEKQLAANKEESNFNRSEINEYNKLVETESHDISINETFRNELEALNESITALTTTIAKAEWQIEQKQNEDAGNQKQLEELISDISKMSTAYTDIQAIDMAISTIEDIAAKVRGSFGKMLNERASEYINKITNGKYDNLVIDEALNITVNSKNKLIKSEKLSKGTIEQIYMALRLAAADILFADDKKPILMDDAFAMYDNKRMANTMKFMASELEQVIIFSCHTREKVMADKLEIPYTLIKL